MLMLHQLYRLPRRTATPRFEEAVRDRWLPAVAEIDGARLAWYADVDPGEPVLRRGRDDHRLRRPVGVRASSRRRPARARSRIVPASCAPLRLRVQTRVLRPLDYDPWAAAVGSISDDPATAAVGRPASRTCTTSSRRCRGQMTQVRRHDARAVHGAERAGALRRRAARELADGERRHPLPEMFNLSEIRDVDALVQLLAYEIPREYKAMGTWMWQALEARDRWTTRLLRSVDLVAGQVRVDGADHRGHLRRSRSRRAPVRGRLPRRRVALPWPRDDADADARILRLGAPRWRRGLRGRRSHARPPTSKRSSRHQNASPSATSPSCTRRAERRSCTASRRPRHVLADWSPLATRTLERPCRRRPRSRRCSCSTRSASAGSTGPRSSELDAAARRGSRRRPARHRGLLHAPARRSGRRRRIAS